MTLPSSDTLVSYPSGAVAGSGTVLHIEPLDDGHTAVLLDATPCHPVDVGWPDQGPDRASLEWGGAFHPLLDCVVGASDGIRLYLGADVPVRKGTEGWAFVVAHLVEGTPPELGQSVTVSVDAGYRSSMSLGHTGCHLASLALNRAVAARWTKEAATDALGSPNFDALAIDSSTILPNGSVDTFRLNKSLRRKGFTTDGLQAELAAIEQALNASLAGWISTDAAVSIRCDGERLTDRRYWECSLPDGDVSIPCGGTHADSLGALGALRATLALSDDDGTAVLTMTTGAGRGSTMNSSDEGVRAHLDTVASEIRRRDAETLLELMGRVSGEEPRMWGPSIIGFGSYHYKYASGREGDAPAAGFSPRKAATSIYLPDGIGIHAEQLTRLGEHKTGVGCLYLKDLAKVDLMVLESIVTESYRTVTAGTFGHRAADS